jgi:hypothetical protein
VRDIGGPKLEITLGRRDQKLATLRDRVGANNESNGDEWTATLIIEQSRGVRRR